MATTTELEARLRRLEDAEALRDLKFRYSALADRRYGPGGPLPRDALEPIAREIAQLFSEDAVWDGGRALGVCRGRQAIYERFLEPTLRFSFHYFVQPRIEIDGDRARARWSVLAPCSVADGRPFWMAGVEHDEYVRAGDTWLHQRMQLEVVLFAPHERGWGAGA